MPKKEPPEGGKVISCCSSSSAVAGIYLLLEKTLPASGVENKPIFGDITAAFNVLLPV